MRAIEVTGSINTDGNLALDQPIDTIKPRRFRGILLFPDTDSAEIQEWPAAAINNSMRELLDDPEEDIYTLEDGDPIDGEGSDY
jgi:hypothetical protein